MTKYVFGILVANKFRRTNQSFKHVYQKRIQY